jgi:hypothetical protein
MDAAATRRAAKQYQLEADEMARRSRAAEGKGKP